MSNDIILETESLSKHWGGIKALNDISLQFHDRQLHGVVGPNGAGKSTAMKAMFGMLDVRSGRVMLDGEDITSLSPQQRVVKGMGFVPQTHNIFILLLLIYLTCRLYALSFQVRKHLLDLRSGLPVISASVQVSYFQVFLYLLSPSPIPRSWH